MLAGVVAPVRKLETGMKQDETKDPNIYLRSKVV